MHFEVLLYFSQLFFRLASTPAKSNKFHIGRPWSWSPTCTSWAVLAMPMLPTNP